MTSVKLLSVEPQDLQFTLELLTQQISCSLQLSNMTDDYVAFMVKTTNPNKYSVRPNAGIVLPRSTCDVIVTMQAQKEMPADMQCKDKFLLQSVVASSGAIPKDIPPEMFNKDSGHRVEESKIRVVYVSPPPPRPPSPGSRSYLDPHFQIYKKERDELEVQLKNSLRLNDELLTNKSTSAIHVQQPPMLEFSFSEIQEATDSFNPSLKIDEGDYGTMFKGFLHCISVSIKLLQTPSHYHQEVQVANRLRHPNLINLIGVCPEACALIYEHLPNGNLEDRLTNNISSPLPWKKRIKISTEICAALIFLHSSNPHPTFHGDLKPRNVLLDANLVSKLKDFGIHHHQQSDLTTVESDVFSFGIILMQLLTGKSDRNLVSKVQDSVTKGNLSTMLDSTAGEWPLVVATQLAHLALSCCDMINRPDLRFEVWTVLESLRVSCEDFSSNNRNNNSSSKPPLPHFVCPIQHEVMQDPVVAADGFSYEAEAIQEWFDLGHDTSPMTNVRLAHKNLIPNQTLRSGIQEWKANH